MTINAAHYGFDDIFSPASSGNAIAPGTSGKASYFGTYDQTGNIAEYTEKNVLLRSDDVFSPVPTPTGTNAFIPSASVEPYPPPPTWPIQYPKNPWSSGINPPTTPVPVPSTQSFDFAKQCRGGSYVSTSGDLSNTSPLSYMLPTDHSASVGFRIASVAEEVSATGLHIPSLTTATTWIEESQASNLKLDMELSADNFDDETRITNISTNTIASGGLDYIVLSLTKRPLSVGQNVSVDFSLSNPIHMKNMVLVDQANNSPDGFTPGYGRVTKNYYIGKYPVTNSEYVAYLNTVAQYDDNNVFYTAGISASDPGMSKNISKGSSKPYAYFCRPHTHDKPVVGITWVQAARYCNWLHNRHNNASTTATNAGAYDLSQILQTMTRSSNAKYFIPTENEWYKAAYYDKQDGSFVWRNYATRTDTVPEAMNRALIDIYGRGPNEDLSDVSLFDRYAVDFMSTNSNNNKWISIINRAMDRWDQYVSLIEYTKQINADYHDGYVLRVRDDSRYQQVRTLFERTYRSRWRGINLNEISFVNISGGFIASCGPTSRLCYTVQNGIARYMPMTARLTINKAYSDDYSDNEWVDIITHELGHALGIGTLWSYIPGVDSEDSLVDGVYMNNNPFLKTSLAYNATAYKVYTGYHRQYTPLEQSGNAGTRGAHWENDFVPSGLCHVPLDCGSDTTYVGIGNELMGGYYVKDAVLSSLSISNLIDLGYYSKHGNLNGEGEFTGVYVPSVEASSLSNRKHKVLGRCTK